MDDTERLFRMWNLARQLVVQTARDLAKDFTDQGRRNDLMGALRAELRSRIAWERAYAAEQRGELPTVQQQKAANHGGGKEQDDEKRDGES